MRQFRGLTKEGKWVYGNYIHSGDTLHYIVPDDAVFTLGRTGLLLQNIYSVIPESVGQQVGLKDKNGKEIYEGDVVKIGNFPDSVQVFWDRDKAAYYTSKLEGNIGNRLLCDYAWSEHNIVEILGNIHQHPNLLEQDNARP